MEIFQYIIENVIKKYYGESVENLENHSKLFALYPMYFFTAHNIKPITKYQSLKNYILENIYLAEKQQKMFFDIFSKSQKIYHSLTRIIRYYKFKKTKLFDMNCDIRFNPLSNFPENQKITLIHYNTRYIFRISDLCNIWKDALIHCVGISPEPFIPKNPFIRKEFNAQQLYAIYFKLKETDFRIPLCIQGFFKYSFKLNLYRYKCYSMLKDIAIDNYFYNESSVTTKLYDIIIMLNSRKNQIGEKYISERCDWETKKYIVSKLEKYLIMHLYSVESCNPIKKNVYEDKCSKELKLFFEENPDFCIRRDLPRYTRRESSILDNYGLTETLRDSIDEILSTPINNPIEEIEEEIEETIEEEEIEETIEPDEESKEIDYPEDEHTHFDLQIPTVAVNLDDIINRDIQEF
jgi:hypothetical protein